MTGSVSLTVCDRMGMGTAMMTGGRDGFDLGGRFDLTWIDDHSIDHRCDLDRRMPLDFGDHERYPTFVLLKPAQFDDGWN